MATLEALLTAEEFLTLPDAGVPSELVRGRIVPMNMPGYRHGRICNRIGALLRTFVDAHDLGDVLNNDAGVITERGPDTVRGPDVSFYSYARVPKGSVPVGYPPAAPELVFEVFSPFDRWPDTLAKAGEYLKAGVEMVCVVDPEHETVTVYDARQPGRTYAADEELAFPEWLGGLSLRVRDLFA